MTIKKGLTGAAIACLFILFACLSVCHSSGDPGNGNSGGNGGGKGGRNGNDKATGPQPCNILTLSPQSVTT